MVKPKSPKTRMREYRARLEENKEKNLAYLEKEKERKKIVRAKEKEIGLGIDVIKHRRLLNRQRVAHYGSKKKASPVPAPEADELVFKTNQSFGGAVSKASKHLPFSPRKKRLVVEKLLRRLALCSQVLIATKFISLNQKLPLAKQQRNLFMIIIAIMTSQDKLLAKRTT